MPHFSSSLLAPSPFFPPLLVQQRAAEFLLGKVHICKLHFLDSNASWTFKISALVSIPFTRCALRLPLRACSSSFCFLKCESRWIAEAASLLPAIHQHHRNHHIMESMESDCSQAAALPHTPLPPTPRSSRHLSLSLSLPSLGIYVESCLLYSLYSICIMDGYVYTRYAYIYA